MPNSTEDPAPKFPRHQKKENQQIPLVLSGDKKTRGSLRKLGVFFSQKDAGTMSGGVLGI
ncbi:hypothetical protein KKF84_15440 [Myxococcota bacterium]|nr:hypothetical protein [Myxococcota bacterium]